VQDQGLHRCPTITLSIINIVLITKSTKKKISNLQAAIKNLSLGNYNQDFLMADSRDEAALNSWEYEMKRFQEKLEDFYNVKITEEDIKKAIEKEWEQKRLKTF